MAVVGRPFKAGNKGGPGRPPVPAEFKKRCSDFTDATVVPAWVEEVETRGPNWMKAAELLAAYGKGKPSQPLEHSGADGAALGISVVFK